MRILFSLALLLPLSALAAEAPTPDYKISSLTNGGQGNFSEALTLNGTHPTSTAEESGAMEWSAGFTRSHLPVSTTSDDNTNAVDLSLGYRKDIDVGVGFSYSKTLEENLTSVSPSLWLGWIFPLGRRNDDGFRPTIEPKFTFKTDEYTQSYSGTVSRQGTHRTITRPVTGSEAIRQNDYSVGLDLSPISFFTLHLGYSSYGYNRNVASFLGLLDSPRSVSMGIASFSDTLGGFPKAGGELGLTIYPWETWNLNLEFSRDKLVIGGTYSTGERIELAKDLGPHWKVGLGFDHEIADQYGQENLTLLDLGYTF